MDSADRPDAGGVGFRGTGAGERLGGHTTPAASRAGQQRAASLHDLKPVSRPSAWFVHTCLLRLLDLEHRLLAWEIHSYHIL